MDRKMNKYETVLILTNDITEEQRQRIIQTTTDYIENNGTIIKVENLGLKKLAYEVKKHKEGYYILIEFETSIDNIHELERFYRITDEILKFIIVKKDE